MVSKTTARIILGTVVYFLWCWFMPLPCRVHGLTYLEGVVAWHLASLIVAIVAAGVYGLAYLLETAFPTQE